MPQVTDAAPTLPPVTDAALTVPPVTDAPATVTPAVADTVPMPPGTTCAATGDPLVTPSGRRVLLRAAEVRPRSPLVVLLHGFTGTPTGIERFAEFTPTANASSIAVAYPEGTPTGVGGFGWTSGAHVFATTGVDDVAALGEMLDVAIATGCVDPGRVVVVGESNGAGMALAAACDARLASRIHAVVLVNAAVDDGVLARCAGGAPLPSALSVVAGELDDTAPYAGGNGLLAQEEWFAAAAALVAGCEAVVGPAVVDEFTRVLSGSPCASCSVLFTVADGTHTWPGASRGNGGLRPGTFDLNARLVWIASAPAPTPCLPW